MKKNKSILRSKKSTVKVSDFLAREGAAALVPGGGLFYEAAKALFQHGKQYFHDRTEDRLEEFHQAILTGNFDEKECEEFLDKEFDLNDYYAVLSSCVQDIEDEKIRIYSQLMQSLIMNVIKPNIRRHFITSSKDLSFQDLCFLRELYINNKYDLMTVGGPPQQVKNLLSTIDIFKDLTIEKLISRGFIHKNKSGITPYGEQYTESIFPTNELKPESIGRKPWTGINIVIVSYQLDHQLHNVVSREVQEALWKIHVKSSIHIIDPKRPTTSLFYGAGVLLVGEKKIENNYKKALENFSTKKPLIRLNLNENASKVELKEIKFAEEFTLQSSKTTEIRRDINNFISKILPQSKE
ncbi:MAG: hypothetical protein NT096_09280 [Proteobacteria bacterium]|nr:hypothetical protein [Pseudomonadota bacterium]